MFSRLYFHYVVILIVNKEFYHIIIYKYNSFLFTAIAASTYFVILQKQRKRPFKLIINE